MTIWRGQAAAIGALLGALSAQRIHHAWLLAGPEGIGKSGIAHQVAKLLLGATRANDPADPLAITLDDPVARLVDAGTHPDLALVRRAPRETRTKTDAPELARNITVNQIRELSQFLHLAPSMAMRRVIIIDSADDLERGAANALLKNLEEPPRDTIFLLVSHAPGRLLATIRSRCRLLAFQPLGEADMRAVLAEAAPELSCAERDRLIVLADGAPGRALAMQALDLPGLEASLEAIATTGDPANGLRVALARALAPKAAQARYVAFLDLVPQFLARRARAGRTVTHDRTARAWADATDLAGGALILSLDPGATVFGLCGIVARLAPERV